MVHVHEVLADCNTRACCPNLDTVHGLCHTVLVERFAATHMVLRVRQSSQGNSATWQLQARCRHKASGLQISPCLLSLQSPIVQTCSWTACPLGASLHVACLPQDCQESSATCSVQRTRKLCTLDSSCLAHWQPSAMSICL